MYTSVWLLDMARGLSARQDCLQCTRHSRFPGCYGHTSPPCGFRQALSCRSQFFYSGSPYDQIARQYMADALSGNTTAGYSGGIGINVTRSEVRSVTYDQDMGRCSAVTWKPGGL